MLFAQPLILDLRSRKGKGVELRINNNYVDLKLKTQYHGEINAALEHKKGKIKDGMKAAP